MLGRSIRGRLRQKMRPSSRVLLRYANTFLSASSEVEKRSFYNIYEFPYFLYMILEIEIY